MKLDLEDIPLRKLFVSGKIRFFQALAGYIKSVRMLRGAGSLVVLAFLVIVGNQVDARALQNQSFLNIDTRETQDIVSSLSPYTPYLDEDITRLAVTLSGEDEEFIKKPSIAQSMKQPVHYVMQKGDTLSAVARKFSTNVATIMDENGIKAAELSTIKPGTELVIPPYQITQSTAWLDEVNRLEEKKRQEIAKQRAEEKRRLRIALASKRALAYRESSSSRAPVRSAAKFIVPINHKGISRGIGRGHTGIDYRADRGTPVVAARSGKVIIITHGWAGGWGRSIVIDHGGGLTSRYAHLSKAIVRVGSYVNQGDVIGYSGSTGFSTGPHLHFETRLNGRVISPF